VIFQRLSIQDFGVYAGKQTLNLEPGADGSIVLVGGQNGEGKTTLLEAILHVLYGAHAGSIIGRGGSYEGFLRSSINKSADPSVGASIELSIVANRDGEETEIEVRRSWQARGDQVKEQLSVAVDGTHDKALTEGWSDFVETLVPRGVAPLFFFDGEKIEDLADLEGASATIRSAVGALLGLDLVDQLVTDLGALQKRLASKVDSGDLKGGLEAAEAAVSTAEQSLTEARSKFASARSSRDQAEAAVERVERRFQAAGGKLYEERAEVEKSTGAASQRVADLRDGLRELAAGDLPLTLCQELLEKLQGQVDVGRRAGLADQLGALLVERDKKLVAWLESKGLAQETQSSLEDWLSEDRLAQIVTDTSAGASIAMSGASASKLESLLASGVATSLDHLNQVSSDLASAKVQQEQAERRIAQIPSDGAIGEILDERRLAHEDRELAASALENARVEVEVLERERGRRREERDRILRRIAESELAEGDSKRVFDHSEKARETLRRLKVEALSRNMKRIEELILESLQGLLRKDRLIEAVEIDPESFELKLFGRNHKRLEPSALSAGERQLTALSLLWGLARAADRPLPLIIDTPLGRLDRSHRSLLLDRYLPFASHQVIVLSTDTEIDEEAVESLGSSIGRIYRLEHSDETQGTEITEGYFFSELEAAA
jgi:DNA sulfur modification protein DndD